VSGPIVHCVSVRADSICSTRANRRRASIDSPLTNVEVYNSITDLFCRAVVGELFFRAGRFSVTHDEIVTMNSHGLSCRFAANDDPVTL
jgi:hypothetical protein